MSNYFVEIPYHLHPAMKLRKSNQFTYCIHNIQVIKGITIEINAGLETSVVSSQKTPEIVWWNSESFINNQPTNSIITYIVGSNQKYITKRLIDNS